MQTGRGATITWTSYNYPSQISNGGLNSNFFYTPDRQYYKQVADFSNGTATTMYIGGILEKVTTSAGTDYRHMIRAGGSIIIVSRQSGGTNTTNYVTSDHLGSSSAVTNSAGAVLVNSSFGAFGARRGANWSGSPSAGDWTAIASTTRRGYTEHSMLDNVNFIHMNGRVQDPLLGRFASADPLISNPEFTQSFNRYSYVTNNPLSMVDPSGFRLVWIQHWCPPPPPDPHPELPSIDVHGIGCGEWQQIPDGPWAPPPDPKGPTEQPPAGPPDQPPQKEKPPCPQVNDPNFPRPKYKDFDYSPNFFAGHGDFTFAITHWYDGADARRLAGITDRLQNQNYPPSNGYDEANAFRHAHVSLMLTQQLGPQTARTIMDAHERSGGGSEGDHLMDLYNNDVAIRASDKLGHLLPSEAVPAIKKLIQQGCLRTSPF